MGYRRVNKFLFVLKVMFVVALTTLTVLLVSQKDVLTEKYCDCPLCNAQSFDIVQEAGFLEGVVSFLCSCTTCD